jgi:hypothetical protein
MTRYKLIPTSYKDTAATHIELLSTSQAAIQLITSNLSKMGMKILAQNNVNFSIFAELGKLNDEQILSLLVLPARISFYKALELPKKGGQYLPSCPLVEKQRRG